MKTSSVGDVLREGKRVRKAKGENRKGGRVIGCVRYTDRNKENRTKARKADRLKEAKNLQLSCFLVFFLRS